MRIELSISAMLCLLLPVSNAQAEEPIPNDFPKFIPQGNFIERSVDWQQLSVILRTP